MSERLDRRVLAAVRWIDAVSRAPITLPLVPETAPGGPRLSFIRNLSGLTVVTEAEGLEAYTQTFDLKDLAPADDVPDGDLDLVAQVRDPTGSYLPRKFTLALPRDASPKSSFDAPWPADSLFQPLEIELLPSPSARSPAGWAQVRVLILKPDGKPAPNTLARAVEVANNKVWGVGLSDERGEALVQIPDLPLFAAGATADEFVSTTTTARLEIVHPPGNDAVIDWTALRAAAVAAGDTDPTPLKLAAGGTYSRIYPFPP